MNLKSKPYCRSAIMILVVLLTLTYWLFYGIWIYEERESGYDVSICDKMNK